ncbi:MAG: AMP-binding protein, partial [Methylococcales bacterium]|nr:AMP-binding protein [Methylococcales bacterium]
INGKVDKKSLPLPDQCELLSQQEFVAASSFTESWLMKKWQKLLNTDQEISIHQNFFELGGDSLIATRTATSIRQKFQIDLPLNQFFAHPNIAELAKWIDQQDKQTAKVERLLPQIKADSLHRFDAFPLNDIQQAYWLGRQGGFDLGNIACHFYVEIEGDSIDIQRLNQAWQKLIERHDMLRMVIHPDGLQQVLEHVPYYNIPTLDLRGQSKQQTDQQWKETRQHLEDQVLPTDRWPLFELAAHIVDEQITRIYFSFDLLMGDVWSFLILSKECMQLYQQPDAELPSLEINFRDYILAEKEILSSDVFNDQWNYWQKRLPTLPNAPDLPLAGKASDIEKPHFVRFSYTLAKAEWQVLKQRATTARLTSSLVLCAVYAEVLARYSKQNDFTLNLTQFNRLPLHSQVNEIVGDFTSLLLLEVNYRSDQTFMQRAKQLFKQLNEDLENNQINGMRVMREMGVQQNRNVSMPVVFTSALPIQDKAKSSSSPAQTKLIPLRDKAKSSSSPARTKLIPLRDNDDNSDDEWLGKRTYNISQTPQVWLDYQVFEEKGDLILSWDLVDELFPKNMIADMFGAMTGLLHQLAKSDQSWHQSTFDLIPDYQIQQIKAVNQTQQHIPNGLLHSQFFQLAQKTPEAIAIISDDLTLSYSELARKAYQIANQLSANVVNQQFCVAIVMQKGWQQVVACLGVLAAGGTYVPIDSHVPESRLKLLLEQIECETVLTQTHVQANFQWESVKHCYCVETDFEQSDATEKIKFI